MTCLETCMPQSQSSEDANVRPCGLTLHQCSPLDVRKQYSCLSQIWLMRRSVV